MKQLTSYFSGGITSFFGFESRLNSRGARSDYLFAVSAKKGEREALASLFENKRLPEAFMQKPEWQQVERFVTTWADPSSVLYKKVLGLWFEFDTACPSSDIPVPSIFIHLHPLRIDAPSDVEQCRWITQSALPVLTGQQVSEKMEHRLFDCIEKLPKGASMLDVGVMLSRSTPGMRLIITRIKIRQIIPYLNSIGWSDENEGLSTLFKELTHSVSRVVLHINIDENGVAPKVGIECSFSPDRYHQETRWSDFLDYLVKKKICSPKKRSALLTFSGVEQEDVNDEFNLQSFMVSARIPHDNFSRALVRYISHVKLVYKPNAPMEAKAYSGVRLFGMPKEEFSYSVQ